MSVALVKDSPKPMAPARSRGVGPGRVILVPMLLLLAVALVGAPYFLAPAAERLRFDLAYQVEPNARTWDKHLRMGRALLERLAPLGARDLIDVHAYLGFVSRYGSSRAQA